MCHHQLTYHVKCTFMCAICAVALLYRGSRNNNNIPKSIQHDEGGISKLVAIFEDQYIRSLTPLNRQFQLDGKDPTICVYIWKWLLINRIFFISFGKVSIGTTRRICWLTCRHVVCGDTTTVCGPQWKFILACHNS